MKLLFSLNPLSKLFQHDYVRYLIAGGSAFISDYSVLIYLHEILGVGIGVSSAAGFITGLISSFAINRQWTFKSGRSKRINRQAFEYSALVVFNLFFTVSVLVLLDTIISPLILKPVITAAITIWNYLIYKKVIFKSQDAK